jgi:hypothetical protein
MEQKDREVFLLFYWCARQGALRVSATGLAVVASPVTWRCKSSTGPARGTVSRTARVSTARWNLKEAEGKSLA